MDLLTACQLAYRKHHLDDDSIGWEELSDVLHAAITNEMGDEEFSKWLKVEFDKEGVENYDD